MCDVYNVYVEYTQYIIYNRRRARTGRARAISHGPRDGSALVRGGGDGGLTWAARVSGRRGGRSPSRARDRRVTSSEKSVFFFFIQFFSWSSFSYV